MRCVICQTAWSYADRSGPAEDCDCGANATREYYRDMGPAEVKYWQKKADAMKRGEWLEPTEAEVERFDYERMNRPEPEHSL